MEQQQQNFRDLDPVDLASMEGAGPHRRLDVLARQLTSAAIDEPALLQLSESDLLCPKALGAVLLHDNGQLRQSIYNFLQVRCLLGSLHNALGGQAAWCWACSSKGQHTHQLCCGQATLCQRPSA